MLGHVTRIGSDKEYREKIMDQVYALGWTTEPHTQEDYDHAERRWRKYADWPADFPDLLIISIAQRLKAQSVWTYDRKMTKLVRAEAPRIQVVGLEGAL